MKKIFVLIVAICFLAIALTGCASYGDYLKAYESYARGASDIQIAKVNARQKVSLSSSGDIVSGNEVCRIKFTKGVSVAGLEEIVCSIPEAIVAGNRSEEKMAIIPPQQPPDILGMAISKVTDVGATFIPWYIAGKELGDVLKTSINNAGHNTSGSYNTSIPTEYTYSNSFNGDYRDFKGDVDNSNRSINDSYNPIDRHDINGSYNPIDRHDTTTP